MNHGPLFLGSFRYAQDRKGRIVVPAEWRDQLGSSVIFTWDGTRLVMRGAADFQRFRDDTLLPSLLCARSWEAPVKALGRILIPHECRRLAGLLNVSDLGWVGLGDYAWLGTWAQVERFVVGAAAGGVELMRLDWPAIERELQAIRAGLRTTRTFDCGCELDGKKDRLCPEGVRLLHLARAAYLEHWSKGAEVAFRFVKPATMAYVDHFAEDDALRREALVSLELVRWTQKRGMA